MAGESKDGSGSSVPYSGIVGALLLAVAVVVQQARLDSARPVPGESSQLLSRSLHQDVEARLWEDPLQAVAQFRDRKRQEAVREGQLGRSRKDQATNAIAPDDAHNVEANLKSWFHSMMCKTTPAEVHDVRLLLPVLMGERDEESAEMRRRTRYGVVSALINAGYAPDDDRAIGYAFLPEASRAKAGQNLPETLPFEWFVRSRKRAVTWSTELLERKEWVLVIWLDSTSFQEEDPLAQFRGLVDLLTPECRQGPAVNKDDWDATVLGPIDSTMLFKLKAAIEAENQAEQETKKVLERTSLRFISASATGSMPDSPFFFNSNTSTLARVVGADNELLDALLRELSLRAKYLKVFDDKEPAAIVISEHDTGYGRAFQDYLEQRRRDYTKRADGLRASAGAIDALGPEFGSIVSELGRQAFVMENRGREHTNLRFKPFFYFRQIDGGKGGNQRRQRGAEKPKEGDKDGTQQAQAIRAHGTSQIDYLERLRHDIERYSEEENKDIVAIGIFGNDVYDKLLVLRALRPSFPKAQFITTDMDARLLDSEEAEWTRNLVVATNFGLTLNDEVQRGAAPFRDGYQAGSYLVAWLFGGRCATKVLEKYRGMGRLPPWLATPLLFEIGRHKAVPLENFDRDRELAGAVDLSACEFGMEKLRDKKSVNFQPRHKQPQMQAAQQGLIAVLVVFALVLLSVWVGRERVTIDEGAQADRPVRERLFDGLSWLALGCMLGGAFLAALASRQAQVPIYFMLSGIVVAVLFCVGLWQVHDGISMGRSWKISLGALLAGPALWLAGWAMLPAVTPNTEPFAWAEGVSVWPTQILRFFTVLLAGFSLWYMGATSASGMRELANRYGLLRAQARSSISLLWKTYSSHRGLRTAFTIAMALAYLVGCLIFIIKPLDARPGIPVRGEFVPQVAALLSCGVYLGIVLLAGMVVAYAAFICSIVKPSWTRVRRFPRDAIRDFRQAYNLSSSNRGISRFADCCLLVELVAQRSAWLSRLIYAPFAVLALNMVARSQLFDNWDTPVGLLIVLVLPFVVVIGCVLTLRFATLRLHQNAILQAERELISLRGAGGVQDAERAQLEKLFEKMRDEKQGAFQNILLQPMIRALLLPLGGFSFIEILDQFVLAR